MGAIMHCRPADG